MPPIHWFQGYIKKHHFRREISFTYSISPDQCYWMWASSRLPVIGNLSEARLFLHSLPMYLKTRDEYRAEREGLPPKWTSLNTSTIRLLPVGSSWKMLKQFCFITFNKYAHGRNRVKGEGGPFCEICGSLDSLLHILCSCQRSDLRDIRYQAYTSLDDLLISWRQSNEISRDEDAMWSRYLSNVEQAGPYGEECWLGVFSDEPLTWSFSRALIIAPFPSSTSMIQFSKRWETMVGLRRKFADAIIFCNFKL
jgi:hypothetical protein